MILFPALILVNNLYQRKIVLYYAKPQRLLNDQGVEATEEERPNYVQISDRRPEHLRNGWQLAIITQSGQFVNPTGNELIGATINLDNQALATAQGGIAQQSSKMSVRNSFRIQGVCY